MESSNGPDTRCGVDYYFVHRRSKIEAYINWDQGRATITVDGGNVFSGMEQELPKTSGETSPAFHRKQAKKVR